MRVTGVTLLLPDRYVYTDDTVTLIYTGVPGHV